MAKIVLLTTALIGAGKAAIAEAIAKNAATAADDILLIIGDAATAEKVFKEELEKAETKYNEAADKLKVLQEKSDADAKDLKAAAAKLKVVEGELKDALDINEELSKQIEKLSVKVQDAKPKEDTTKPIDVKEHSFEKDGVSYGFVYPKLNWKGKAITAKDVVDDEDLQAELIAAGSTMIFEKD